MAFSGYMTDGDAGGKLIFHRQECHVDPQKRDASLRPTGNPMVEFDARMFQYGWLDSIWKQPSVYQVPVLR